MLATALIVLLAAEPTRLELEIELDTLRSEQPSALWFMIPSMLAAASGSTLASVEMRDWRRPARPADVWEKTSLAVGAGSLVFGLLFTTVIAYLRHERFARIVELEARVEELRREDDARLEHGLGLSPARHRIRALEDERPGLGGAATLLLGGVVAGALSIMNWAVWNGSEGTFIVLGLTLDLVAAGLVGAGLWQLIARSERRAEIDLEIRRERELDADP